MLDIAPTELLMVAAVALLIIGPKDLPKAMRVVGHWVGRARGVARQFRSGFDAMVREAELAEMEKKWAEENARIMRENPLAGALPKPSSDPDHYARQLLDSGETSKPASSEDGEPQMVERPQVKAEPAAPVPAPETTPATPAASGEGSDDTASSR